MERPEFLQNLKAKNKKVLFVFVEIISVRLIMTKNVDVSISGVVGSQKGTPEYHKSLNTKIFDPDKLLLSYQKQTLK